MAVLVFKHLFFRPLRTSDITVYCMLGMTDLRFKCFPFVHFKGITDYSVYF